MSNELETSSWRLFLWGGGGHLGKDREMIKDGNHPTEFFSMVMWLCGAQEPGHMCPNPVSNA
jgi:hypothetical protein